MAETDILYEFGREPGFSCSVFSPESSHMLHKDKILTDQKKDVVYHWECKADGCKSSYIGETSKALGERVKEHCKSSTSAILKHCTDFHHPLPSVTDFNIIMRIPSKSPGRPKKPYIFKG